MNLEEHIAIITAQKVDNSDATNTALTNELRGVLSRSFGTHRFAPVNLKKRVNGQIKSLQGYLVLLNDFTGELESLKTLAKDFGQTNIIYSDSQRLTQDISLTDDNVEHIGKLVAESYENASKNEFFIHQVFGGNDFYFTNRKLN
jgi:hypothetical protein